MTVLVACSYPYVYLPVLAALRGLDPAHAEVASSLGCGRLASSLRVTLPAIRPAMTSGALLVALYVMSEFGAVSLMRYETLTNGIYLSYVGSFDRTPAAILGSLLVAVSSVLVFAEARSRGSADRAVAGRARRRRSRPLRLGVWQVPALAACGGMLYVALGVPATALGRWFARTPDVDVDLLRRTLLSTMWVSALGALACAVLAVPIALLATRFPTRTSAALEAAGYLGHALPGIVIALSMVFLGSGSSRRFTRRCRCSSWRTSRSSCRWWWPPRGRRSDRSRLPSRRSPGPLGRGAGAAVVGVTFRIAAPGILAGAALVALTCVKELPATLLLRPSGFDTLATRVWTNTSVADYGAAAPYAMCMVVLGIVPMLLLGRAGRR